MVASAASLTVSHVEGGKETELVKDVSLGQLIQQSCVYYGLQEALRFVAEDKNFLFSTVLQESDRLATSLLRAGLLPGQHVALWGANHADNLLCTYACARAGLVFTHLNHTMDIDALLHQLALVDAKCLICFPSVKPGHCYNLLREKIPEIENVVPGKLDTNIVPTLKHVIMAEGPEGKIYPGCHRLNDLLVKTVKSDMEKLNDICAGLKSHQTATIQFTSGASGDPKPVMLSHFQVINGCSVAAKRLYLDQPGELLCCPVPIFRTPIMVTIAFMPFVAGTRLIYPSPSPLPPAIFETIEKFKCTCIISNPIAFHLMLRLPVCAKHDISSLSSVCLAGEHIPSDLIANMQKNTSVIDVTIGLFSSEVPAMPFMFPANGDAAKLVETIGSVADNYAGKVVDSKGTELAPGKIGELWLRPVGGSDFLGYYKDEAATVERYRDGWVFTGDMATMDAAGYVKLICQKSDIITHKKKIIYPPTMEKHLNTHKLVAGSQVVGLGDSQYDQKLVICVVSKDRSERSDKANAKLRSELIELCKEEKLPEPDHIIFMKDFPRTLTKKVQKYKLKKMLPDLIKKEKS